LEHDPLTQLSRVQALVSRQSPSPEHALQAPVEPLQPNSQSARGVLLHALLTQASMVHGLVSMQSPAASHSKHAPLVGLQPLAHERSVFRQALFTQLSVVQALVSAQSSSLSHCAQPVAGTQPLGQSVRAGREHVPPVQRSVVQALLSLQ
jgi:hypothetical protein